MESIDPQTVVQWQLDAWNARDIDLLLTLYATDAKQFEHPCKLLAAGAEELRARFAARFQEPNLHATLLHRITIGNIVVDHEKISRTFPEGRGTIELLATYEVIHGKIANAWFIFGPKQIDAVS